MGTCSASRACSFFIVGMDCGQTRAKWDGCQHRHASTECGLCLAVASFNCCQPGMLRCAVGKWTFEAMVEQYGDVCFSVARPTSGQAPMLLRDYVDYMKVWRCLGYGSVGVRDLQGVGQGGGDEAVEMRAQAG